MEITEIVIPAPRFLKSKNLTRALIEADIPEAALALLAADFRLPEQLLLDNRIVASIVIRRQEDPLPLRRPRQIRTAPRQIPRASYPQLELLETRARREPALRRHRHFWLSLEDAKAGRRLALRQRQLLELAWKKLERIRRQQSVNFSVHGRRLTRTTHAFARWLDVLFNETAPAPTAGSSTPHRRANEAVLADMTPQRHDIEHRRRPNFTDTDSGDEG